MTTTPTEKPDPSGEGQTRTKQSHGHAPRMPHERDQSADSQEGEPTERGKRALNDLESGRKDTDRGQVAHDTYQKQK
ncbi:hypothetical protein [Pseudacidovorax sp. RU35E]|jgi:hypothetical protein|uniref:hypothetical protein n=1 Tax=Pseudacidovorax sp. RU35E TaxID=1907403 RepID=UPI000953E461|nr:hypothetical protein [Pseudacidovorax sp. RU35E]SIQ74447.1 hypothetical protein SAMN05880557_105255 [Pseudacidovorax sp. RU35E]